jgi:hypothetical protein
MAAALVALVSANAGCSSGGGGTGLETALARIADTANNRSEIFYDDTSALVQLAGTSPTATKGFALLRAMGAGQISASVYVSPANAGINLYGESYAVTAGLPPQMLTVLDGGQNASQVTSHLTKLGFKHIGDRLVAPSGGAGSTAEEYAEVLAQVQPSGADLLVGTSKADLSQVGSPTGQTLAGDPGISALASCLGNVVAAEIFSGVYLGGQKPAAEAVGILQPASDTATPQAVVCVSWPTQAAAAQYATDVQKDLASGSSTATNERYSKILTHPTVTNIGGSQHVVQWQADTPGNASQVFNMVDEFGLPGLTDCAELSQAAKAQVPGCS